MHSESYLLETGGDKLYSAALLSTGKVITMASPDRYDVAIIGAGAAGLMCAITAGQRGRKVVVLDQGKRPGRKILLSGGGRCNFTNMYTSAENYLSENTHFAKSALARYTQWDFQALVDKYNIPWHEKTLGQLFCDNSSQDILNLLLDECQESGVEIRSRSTITGVEQTPEESFAVMTDGGWVEAESVVLATGGLSFPTMGVSDLGYQIARQFGHDVTGTRPALVPLTLAPELLSHYQPLSGVSAEVIASCNGQSFRENLLFTHKGFSGPAILQISSYWQPGQKISINWLPDINTQEWLEQQREERQRVTLATLLAEHVSRRLAKVLTEQILAEQADKPIAQWRKGVLERVAEQLANDQILPAGDEGYKKAEVTLGGVCTRQLSSKTMESRLQKGLYFIGEVVDVTGHLGGFNFQWAWASGYSAGMYA